MKITSKTIEQRILSNIKLGSLFEGEPCWEWQGCKSVYGHGRVSVGQGSAMVHRITFMAKVGPIASNLDVHHKCENPSCCNPAHLEALTRKEHIGKDSRRISLPRQSARAALAQREKKLSNKFCKWGHELTSENTYYPPARNQGGKVERVCRVCLRNRPSQLVTQKRKKK